MICDPMPAFSSERDRNKPIDQFFTGQRIVGNSEASAISLWRHSDYAPAGLAP
jgi:hypothetical protein